MSITQEVQDVLATMKLGDVREFPGMSPATVRYAVRAYCRAELATRVLDFDLTSKSGVATVKMVADDD